MSDTVAIALIGMFEKWGLAIIEHGPGIVMAIGSVIVTVGGWWISRKVSNQGRQIVQSVESVKAAAVTTADQAQLMAKGAERRGVEIGIQTERNRASDLQALRDNYRPESTDVFMARTEDEK